MNPINDEMLPPRIRNVLAAANLDTREKLKRAVSTGSFMMLRGMGRSSLRVVEAWLKHTAPGSRVVCHTCHGAGWLETNPVLPAEPLPRQTDLELYCAAQAAPEASP